MDKVITYEQPLNERVRAFLRMEYLFRQVNSYLGGNSEWDARNAVGTLIEIADFLTRTDVKTELIKELERHSNTLNGLVNSPAVDGDRLKAILQKIDQYLEKLKDSSFQPGQRLRQNDLITSVKQRLAIPGGTCNFDIPAFYFWLYKPENVRNSDLEYWINDLVLLKESIQLSLQMIRNSNSPSRETAERGFFQRQIDANVSCQLIRVVLPYDSKCYPEISGGKHRFAIRFMEMESSSTRPVQASGDITFELHCCIL